MRSFTRLTISTLWARIGVTAFGVVVALAFAGALPSQAHASIPSIFTGTVSDVENSMAPIPNVVVAAEFWNTETMAWDDAGSTTTGLDGSYTLANTMSTGIGTYNVSFTPPLITGYPKIWVFADWNGVSATELNQDMGQAPVIANGVVSNGTTATPLAGAFVTAYFNSGTIVTPLWSQIATAVTGIDGKFTIRDKYDAGDGDYRFKVAPPVGPAFESHLEVNVYRTWNGTDPLSLEVVLAAAKPLATGTIRDAATDSVLSAGSVDAYAWVTDGSGSSWKWTGTAQSGYDGVFTVKDLLGYSAGDYRFVISAPEGAEYGAYEQKTVLVHWDGGSSLTLDASLAKVIASATVLCDGVPVSGATLKLARMDGGFWIDAETTVTPGSGAVVFKDYAGVGAGDYKLVADKAGYGITTAYRTWNATQTLSLELELELLQADEFEPDGTFGFATAIEVTTAPQAHTIYPAGDADVASFAMKAGTTYLVRTTDTHGPADTKIELWINGVMVAENDDAVGEYGRFSRLEYYAEEDVVAYIKTVFFGAADTGFYGLRVTESAHAPVAAADNATCSEDTSAVVNVLMNDSDEDGDELSAIVVQPPSHGSFVGTVYTPDPNWHGVDTMYYVASDGALDSQATVVQFTVTPLADAATLALTTGNKVLAKIGDSYTCAGSLRSGATSLSSAPVILLQSAAYGGPYTVVAGKVATTTVAGTFSISGIKPLSKTYYKVRYAGLAEEYEATESSPFYVMPRAYVSNPVAPSVMYVSRSKTAYGYLKPRHSGSPIRIYIERYVSGKWRPYSSVAAKAVSYSSTTTTKYSASIRMPYRGKWRIRAAHPADAGHAVSWSVGYDYITVR